MKRGRLFIDTFTTLHDLPRKAHRDPLAVLHAVMAADGRFSCFDATETMAIARTMTFIEYKSGWVRRAAPQPCYPWVQLELTDAGRAAMTTPVSGAV